MHLLPTTSLILFYCVCCCCISRQQQPHASPYVYGDRNNEAHLAKFADKYDFTQGDDIVTYELPWWHPEIEWAVIDEIPGPSFHPQLDNDSAFQTFIRANTDENHQFLDPDTYGYIQSPDASWVPKGHPIIDDYFTWEDLPKDKDLPTVPSTHPDVHEAYLSGEQQPKGHPSVSLLLQNLIPEGHPDIDDLLLDREELPSWHPDLNLIVYRSITPAEPVEDHASSEQTDSKEEDDTVHSTNPTEPIEDDASTEQTDSKEEEYDSVDPNQDNPTQVPSDDESKVESELPSTNEPKETDYDSEVSSDVGDEPQASPSDEVGEDSQSDAEIDNGSVSDGSFPLSSRLNSKDLAAFAKRYDFTQGDDIVTYELPFWHPEIEWAVMNEVGGPSFHPFLDNDPEFQRFIRANTDEDHKFLDPDSENYIRNPDRSLMPRGHPIIDSYFIYKDFPEEDLLPTVPSNHPDPYEAFLNGDPLPPGHPSISLLLKEILPDGHPDINGLFLEELRELPSWHPEISSFIRPQELATSPGSILCYTIGALLIIVALVRALTKRKHSTETRELIISKDMMDETYCVHKDDDTDEHSSQLCEDIAQSGVEIVAGEAVIGIETVIDPNHTSTMICRDSHNDMDRNLNTNEERILVYKEKESNWKTMFGKRVKKTNHSTGEALTYSIYLLINVVALFASPTYGFGAGFGSLSIGNTLFLFLTAARNSVLTWVAGFSFDQALVFHRFIGRLMVLLAFIHACFHIDYITGKTSDQRTITGLIALGCGFVIVLSSLNVIRRKYFNVFFWSHYSFVGFIVAVWLHAAAARPFILASVVCYGLDKGLQLMWKWPSRTLVFDKVDDRVVHCQFRKASLSSLLKNHDVGQYVFVNFPSLSLKEWHPFTVASGPSDPHIDIYIKALGDHTQKIMDYTERCATEKKDVKIRVDGPYGSLPFNYRRYGHIFFVAGGIGITPALSFLKDIYHNPTDSTRKKRPANCIKDVTVVWVIPYASESLFLLEKLNSFRQMSLNDPHLPNLKVSVYVTRGVAGRTKIEGQQFYYSRPEFNAIMDECIVRKPGDSTLVYACGPTKMVKQLWDESSKRNNKDSRVDFYHETFEF